MKKLFNVFFFLTVFFGFQQGLAAQAYPCSGITLTTLSQPGGTATTDYFSAKVTLDRTYTKDIRVLVTISENGNGNNNRVDTLVVEAGTTSAEGPYFSLPLATGANTELKSYIPCDADFLAIAAIDEQIAAFSIAALHADTLLGSWSQSFIDSVSTELNAATTVQAVTDIYASVGIPNASTLVTLMHDKALAIIALMENNPTFRGLTNSQIVDQFDVHYRQYIESNPTNHIAYSNNVVPSFYAYSNELIENTASASTFLSDNEENSSVKSLYQETQYLQTTTFDACSDNYGDGMHGCDLYFMAESSVTIAGSVVAGIFGTPFGGAGVLSLGMAAAKFHNMICRYLVVRAWRRCRG
jgi:hypothetical protein